MKRLISILLILACGVIIPGAANATFPAIGGIKNNLAKGGWNPSFATDSNLMALWNFDVGEKYADSKGAYTLIPQNSPGDSTTDYRQGDQSIDFDRVTNEYLSRSGTASDFGWNTANGLSVTGWVKADTSVENFSMSIFHKQSTNKKAISINYHDNSVIRLLVDGDDNNTWETFDHATAMTDGQWYHFGVTVNTSTWAYRIRIWDDNGSAILGTDKTGTLTNGMANLDQDGTIFISSGSGYGIDGHEDELTVWNKELSTADIDAIRSGTY